MAKKTPEDFIRELAAHAAEVAAHRFGPVAEHYTQLCESPIERVLYAALLAEHENTPLRVVLHAEAWTGDELMMPGVHFWPQTAFGKYRVDFAGFVIAKSHKEIGRFAIECDGHDFHEKTKEQAQKDKARDRWLVTQNIKLMRFTGSEIWRDPIDCVSEVLLMAESIWQAAHGDPG